MEPKQNPSVGYQQPVAPSLGAILKQAASTAVNPNPLTPVLGSEAESVTGGSKYDEGLVRGEDPQAHRANQQSAWAKVGARVARVLPDIALGVAEQVGYIGDLENVAGAVGASETDFDNWLSTAARKGKEALGEAVPVYRRDNDTFSPGDSGWWIDNAADLVESIGEFYLTGAGTGALLGRGAEMLGTKLAAKGLAESIRGAKSAQGIVEATEGAANLTNKLVSGAQFATSSLQAYTGGVMQAQESYRNIYAQGIAKGYSEEESKSAAAQAAASIVRWTTASTSLLNISSLGPIFRPFKREVEFGEQLGAEALSRRAAGGLAAGAEESLVQGAESTTLLEQLKSLRADPSSLAKTESFWKKMFKPEGLGWEMGQEATEEFLENAAQVKGERVGKDKLGDTSEDDYFSKEALLAAALGAVGGAIGKGFMSGIDRLNGNEERESGDFAKAIDLRIDSLEKYKSSKEALVQAVQNKDSLSTMLAKNELFSHNVFHAIQNETGDLLNAAYQDVLNLDPKQAEAAGYDVDEKSPTYYKKTAQEAVAHLESSQQIYDSVLQDKSVPNELKGEVISGLVAMDMMKRQEDSLSSHIDSLYAKERAYEPHVATAKRLDNTVRALEAAQAILSNQSVTAQSNDRLLEITTQLEQAKGELSKFTNSLDPAQQESIKKLPTYATDPVILNAEVQRAVAKGQHERLAKSTKELYDPKTRKARLDKITRARNDEASAKTVGDALTGIENEVRTGITETPLGQLTPTNDKTSTITDAPKVTRPLTIAELQSRIDQAKGLVTAHGDTPYTAGLNERVKALEKTRDDQKATIQARNEQDFKDRQASYVAAQTQSRLTEQAQFADAQLRDRQELENEISKVYDATPQVSMPVHPLTNQRASKVRGPRPATAGNESGLVDLNENGQPVFAASDGTELLLNPKKSLLSQGITVYENAVAPQVVNLSTIDGQSLTVSIGDENYRIGHLKPMDSLTFTEGGNLLSVTLINSEGNEVILTDPSVIYDVADPILLYQTLLDNFLEQTFEMEYEGRKYLIDFDHTNPIKSKVLSSKGTPLLTGMDNYRTASGEFTRKGHVLNAVMELFHKDIVSKVLGNAAAEVIYDNEDEAYWESQNRPINETPFVEDNERPQDLELPGETTPAVSQGPTANTSQPDSQSTSGVSAQTATQVPAITTRVAPPTTIQSGSNVTTGNNFLGIPGAVGQVTPTADDRRAAESAPAVQPATAETITGNTPKKASSATARAFAQPYISQLKTTDQTIYRQPEYPEKATATVVMVDNGNGTGTIIDNIAAAKGKDTYLVRFDNNKIIKRDKITVAPATANPQSVDVKDALPDMVRSFAAYISDTGTDIKSADLHFKVNNFPLTRKVWDELIRLKIVDQKGKALLSSPSDALALIRADAENAGKIVETTKLAEQQAATPKVDPAVSFAQVVTPVGPTLDPSEPTTPVHTPATNLAVLIPGFAGVDTPTQAREATRENMRDYQDKPERVQLADSKPTDTPRPAHAANSPKSGSTGLRVANANFTFKRYANGLSLVFTDGLPTKLNPEENIDVSGLSSPDLKAGSSVSFELGTNDWWKTRINDLNPSDHWKEQPIYVLHNGKRIAKLESTAPERQAIHSALTGGQTVTSTVKSKEANNLINLKNADGTPNLRSVGVTGGSWSNGKFVSGSPVLAVSIGMNPDGEFLPQFEHFTGIDKETLPEEIAAKLNLSVGSTLHDGQLYSIIQQPNGEYFPFKVSTSNLTPEAVGKIISYFKEENVGKITDLVYSATPDDQAEATSRKYFNILPTSSGYLVKWNSPAAGGIVGVDLKQLAKALREGGEVLVADMESVTVGDEVQLRRKKDAELRPLDAQKDLETFLSTKKFHIDKSRVNTSRRVTSPLTGREYENYNAYLGSVEELGGKSIVQTDAWGDGFPDGSGAGVFHYNIGMSFGEITAAAKPATVTESAKSELKANAFEDDLFAVAQPAPVLSKAAPVEEEDDVYRLGDENTMPRDMNKAKAWLEERGIPTEIHDYIRSVGSKVAHGSFSKGAAKLWRYSDEGTEFHEGFHGVLRGFLTPKQRESILLEAGRRYGMEGDTLLAIEERLAEDFRYFMLTGERPKDTTTRNLFQRIWQAIKTYFSNKLTIDRLFDSIQDNTFYKSNKQAFSDEEVYSAKSMFSAKSLAEITDAIAGIVINSTGNTNKALEKVRDEFLVRALVNEDATPGDAALARQTYENFFKGKIGSAEAKIPGTIPLFAHAQTNMLLRVYEGWYDVKDDSEYSNLLEKGWQTLALERMKYYGYRIQGDLMDFVEENTQEDKIYSQASVESSVKDSVAAPVRKYLMQVPLLDNTGKIVTNLLGTPVFVEYNSVVFPQLQAILANSRNINEMVNRLNENIGNFPWVAHIVKGLINGYGDVPADKFRNQFFVAMNMIAKKFTYLNSEPTYTYQQGKAVRVGTKMRSIDSNTSNVSTSTRRKWDARAHQDVSVGGSGLFVVENGEYRVDKSKLQQVTHLVSAMQAVTPTTDLTDETGKAQVENLRQLLTLFGASIEPGVLEQYFAEGDKVRGKNTTGGKLFHWLVNDKVSKKERDSPGLSVVVSTLAKDGNPYAEDANVMGRLAGAVSKYLPAPTSSFMSLNSKSIYTINLPTALDERMDFFQNNPEYAKGFLRDPFYCPERIGTQPDENGQYMSWMLYGIIKDANFQQVFSRATNEGIKDKENGRTTNVTFDDLMEKKDIKTRLGKFLGSGESTMEITFPTFADRGKMDFLKIPRISYDAKLHKHQPRIEEMMLSYVLQDIARARRANREFEKAFSGGKTSKLIANYHFVPKMVEYRDGRLYLKEGVTSEQAKGRAMQFTQWDFLQGMDEKSAGKRLMAAGLASGSDNDFLLSFKEMADLRSEVLNDIQHFLLGEEKKLKDKLTELDIKPIDLDLSLYNNSLDAAIHDYVMADALTRNEIAKLFGGDEAFFKSHEGFSKRFGIIESPGYKSAEHVGNKDSHYGDFSTFGMAIINDQKTSKDALTYVESLSKYLSNETLRSYQSGANKTDAMGFTTVEKHRAKLMGRGDWTRGLPGEEFNHEQAYLNYTGSKGAQKGALLGEFMYFGKKGKIIYPPLTPIKTLTDAMMMVDDRMVRVVIKHSTFPLLVSLTRAMPGLNSLREHMEGDNNLDVVNMDSASKAALWGNISLESDEEGNFTNLKDLTITNIRMSDEKSPQIVPDSQANDPLLGSQFKKMVITNLGSNINYVLANGKTLSGKNLFDNFNSVGASMIAKSQQELYDKLSYRANSMTDPVARKEFLMKLRTDLLNGSNNKDLSDNYLKALGLSTINGQTDFTVPLSLPSVQRKFEGMLLGNFRKNVMQQRIHGTSMVQIAELGGHSFQTNADAKKNGELKFVSLGKDAQGNDIIDHAEVAIPFKLAEKLGIPKVRDANGNETSEFDLNGIDNELLTLIGYRIPTQGKNSMLPMKVVRILPPNVKAIMVPGFITKQMGSDFDVDKLFLMQKNYEEVYTLKDGTQLSKVYTLQRMLRPMGYELTSGEIKQLFANEGAMEELVSYNPSIGDADKFKDDYRRELEALEARLEGARVTVRKVSYDAVVENNLTYDDYRERLENYLIDMSEAILRSPHHANEILSSVDSDTLPKLAAEAIEIDARLSLKKKGIDNPTSTQIKAESTLSAQGVLTEIMLSQRNKTGGAGIGMYATAMTGHAIGQYLYAGDHKLSLAGKVAVRLDGLAATDLTVTIGPEAWGKQDISYGYNERLTAAVDNANTPVMYFVNDNSFTYPVINLLLRAGAGNDIATYLCRQPIIKELTALYQNKEMTPDQLGQAIEEVAAKYDGSFDLKNVKETSNLNVATLKSAMSKTVAENSAHQLEVLKNFYLYHRTGRMLSKVNKVANSDRISDMSTMSGIEEFQDIQDEITNPTRNAYIENADLVLGGETSVYPLVHAYQETIDEAQDFAANFFPYVSEGMRAVKATVRDVLNKTSLNRETLNAINQDAALYLFLRTGSPFKDLLGDVSSSVEELMNGRNSVVNRLNYFKDKHRTLANQRKVSADKLLSRLVPSTNNSDPTSVVKTLDFSSSYGMSQFEQNEIIDAFLQLLNSKDELDRNFGRDLIRYTLLSTGFTPTNDSLMEYIPLEFWTDKRYYPNTTTMADFFRNNPPDLTWDEQGDFADKFIRNNTHVKGLVPNIYGTKDNPIKSGASEIVVPVNRKYYDSDNDQWVRYVSFADAALKTTVLYRFAGTNDIGSAVYVRIDPLGVPYQLKNYSSTSVASPTAANVSAQPASVTGTKNAPTLPLRTHTTNELRAKGSALTSSTNIYQPGIYTLNDGSQIALTEVGQRRTFSEIQDPVAWAKSEGYNTPNEMTSSMFQDFIHGKTSFPMRVYQITPYNVPLTPQFQAALDSALGDTYHPDRAGC